MSEFKGTPGPWTALIEGENTWGSDSHSVVAGEHFAGIADVMIECEASTHGEDGITHVTQEQGIANARLIAASPILLGQHEADMVDLGLLAKAIHAGDPMPELIIRVTDMMNRKRAAIAKATGGEG